ncbi:MAG: hypothetical protein ACI8RZ_005754 [Myxococcota bacterium]|jgi:uncharacterized protein (DUF952 family)
MGFNIEINSILRSDDDFNLDLGAINPFSKDGSRVFFDNIPIWLTRRDWTAIAEIQVVSQTRADGGVTGSFKVRHVYDTVEQAVVTEVFRRMYASGGDPYICLLISAADYAVAAKNGTLYNESLKTDGFIHASPADELTRVANKYYTDVKEALILVTAIDQIDAIVKWEPATGGLYPHIYGPLNMDAVAWVVPATKDADGQFDITPEDLTEEHAIGRT